MNFKFAHVNFNVKNLDESIAFYKQALDLEEVRRKSSEDKSFIIAFLNDKLGSPFQLELTWLADHPQAYDLGEEEFHLAFRVDDFVASYNKHKEMGCICYENKEMGIYFINDPDGYWIEIIPTR